MTLAHRFRPQVLAAALALVGAGPAGAQTGLTIYNDGRVLVRRTLPAALTAGVSNHRLSLGLLDPHSVFALDSGVAIVGTSYDESVDETNTMRRAVGTTLQFLTGRVNNGVADTTSALVVGVNPERFRLADGRISFQRPGLPLYPAELVLADPTLVLAVRSPSAQPALRLGYFTQGAAWSASYTVVLGKSVARISGLASVASGTLRVTAADVQLLAGSVGRAGRGPTPMMMQEMKVAGVAGDVAQGPAEEQQIGEAHLYTIPGKVSLEPGVTTGVALFEPAAAPWERAYVVRGQIPYYGMLPQFGNDENTVPVEVWYTLKRTAKTPFGDLPLPMGGYRLYQPDDAGRLQLIGESAAGHTAPGRDVRLGAGSAFDLTAKRIQTTYTTRRDSTRTVATADYKVTITSAKDTAVTVEVLEERAGEWSVLSSSIPAEKLSSTRTRFRIRVPAMGEASLTYRVRVVW
ncbi:MAG TPA: hypothetical protein VFU23_01110 [Gemmatimonadales bacterium]|nr:hypothetical protein [Gemmatimonadales bacterium]